jgi:hypothetical protein
MAGPLKKIRKKKHKDIYANDLLPGIVNTLAGVLSREGVNSSGLPRLDKISAAGVPGNPN